MSQDQAAQEIGVSRPTLIAIEQGRWPAKPTEIISLARLYGREIAELVRISPAVSGLVAQFRVGGSSVGRSVTLRMPSTTSSVSRQRGGAGGDDGRS